MTDIHENTGIFDLSKLNRLKCADCSGTGEVRYDSENINENFEVESQVLITPCTRCGGTGFVAAG